MKSDELIGARRGDLVELSVGWFLRGFGVGFFAALVVAEIVFILWGSHK